MMLRRLREMMLPSEFRIPGPEWAEEWLDGLSELLKMQPPDTQRDGDGTLIARVAVSLWRAKQKLLHSAGAESVRDFGRLVDSAWDALLQAGVEVADHAGERVTGGEAFHVLAYEPVPGLVHEQVIETVRPTVYHRGVLLQAGQVIVGKPSGNGGNRNGEQHDEGH
jgi:hypothetical protein